MNKKMMSAIQKLVLTDATFNGETVEPTFINFFYGKNGAGKSTIARTIRGNLPGSVEWQSDRPADSYDVLVYDADFIRDNFENYDIVALRPRLPTTGFLSRCRKTCISSA